MITITQYQAALFNKAPVIGDINPDGEIHYVGYSRVPVLVYDDTNAEDIVFPKCNQDSPVRATHLVVLDGAGRVVHVEDIK